MKLNRRFREFLRDEVNLNPDILRRLQTSVRDVNRHLRDRLPGYQRIDRQGSYGLDSLIKPVRDDDEYDADIQVVMNMSVAAWAAVASSIVAAVSHCVAAGSFLVAWKPWRRDELAVRRDVLRRLVGNAYRLTQRWQGQEGEPFIVYADFPRVTSALENMHNELGRDGWLSPNLVTVVMAMADAAKVPVKSLNERFITSPFVPGKPGGRLEA